MNPTVSVIVRTVRRAQRLRECLQTLAAQTYREFELVLVDMNESPMTSIVEEMRTHLPIVRHLRLKRACSRPAALNRGIESARAGSSLFWTMKSGGTRSSWEYCWQFQRRRPCLYRRSHPNPDS